MISKFSKLCFSRGSYAHIDLFQDKKHCLSFLNFVLRVFQVSFPLKDQLLGLVYKKDTHKKQTLR